MVESNFDEIISEIIFDSPVGEIQDVYKSLVTIVGENAKDTILDVIQQYNIKNNIPIDVDGNKVILSEHNKNGASRYFDPINAVSFTVDHLNRKGLDIEPFDTISLTDEHKKIYDQLLKYTNDTCPGDAVLALYPIVDEGSNEEIKKIEIIINSAKYNPSNFWNGDWRSKYIFDLESKEINGRIAVKIHYYEDGNVNFSSNKDISQDNVSDVLKAISETEKEFEKSLDVSFTELNEKQFKALRRRLPITRSKVNWGKAIGNYRLGRDAAQGHE